MWAIIALSVLLTWSDNSDNESGFNIERNGILYGSVGADVNSFIDYAAMEGDCYRVNAWNDNGVSGWSNIACVPIKPPCVPRGKSGKCK